MANPKPKAKKVADPMTAEKAKLLAERKELTAKDKPTKADTARIEEINARVSEIKAEKFRKLASARTVKAINAIRGLQRLTNKNSYNYTVEQSNKIIGALKDELVTLAGMFEGKKEKTEGFEL